MSNILRCFLLKCFWTSGWCPTEGWAVVSDSMWGGVESADGWSWKPHIFTSSTWSHLGQLEGQRSNGSFSGSFLLGLEFGVVDFQPKSVFLRVYRRLVMKSYLVKLLHVEPCGLSDEHDWLLLVQATLKWKLPAPWFLLKLWFTWPMVVSDWYHLLTGQNRPEECVVVRWFPMGK